MRPTNIQTNFRIHNMSVIPILPEFTVCHIPKQNRKISIKVVRKTKLNYWTFPTLVTFYHFPEFVKGYVHLVDSLLRI